jgi:hypothetical protein
MVENNPCQNAENSDDEGKKRPHNPWGRGSTKEIKAISCHCIQYTLMMSLKKHARRAFARRALEATTGQNARLLVYCINKRGPE